MTNVAPAPTTIVRGEHGEGVGDPRFSRSAEDELIAVAVSEHPDDEQERGDE